MLWPRYGWPDKRIDADHHDGHSGKGSAAQGKADGRTHHGRGGSEDRGTTKVLVRGEATLSGGEQEQEYVLVVIPR